MKLALFPRPSSAIAAVAIALVPIACGSQPGDPTASDTQALDPGHFCDPPVLPPAPTLTATVTCLGGGTSINITGEGFVHKSCTGWVGGDNVTLAWAALDKNGQTGYPNEGTSNVQSAASEEPPRWGAPQIGEIQNEYFFEIDPNEFPVTSFVIAASDVTSGVQANGGQPVIVPIALCLQSPPIQVPSP